MNANPYLSGEEAFVLRVSAGLMLVDLTAFAIRGVRLDMFGFSVPIVAAVALCGLGFAYRVTGRSEPIASTAISAGLLIFFSLWLGSFTYARLPFATSPIDSWFAQIDGVLGYRYPDVIALAARHPLINDGLRVVYMSSLGQIALLTCALGLTKRTAQLRLMLSTIVVAAVITALWWSVFPSIGPSWVQPSPDPRAVAIVAPMLGPQWGADTLKLLAHGVHELSPADIQGLIGFPSFHMVFVCVMIYFSRTFRTVLPVVVGLNLLVVPALLVHGSHHLIDVPGGFIVFVVALQAARRVASTSAKNEQIVRNEGPIVASHETVQRTGLFGDRQAGFEPRMPN